MAPERGGSSPFLSRWQSIVPFLNTFLSHLLLLDYIMDGHEKVSLEWGAGQDPEAGKETALP